MIGFAQPAHFAVRQTPPAGWSRWDCLRYKNG